MPAFFQPEEFSRLLASQELTAPPALFIQGYVRRSDEPGTLTFLPGSPDATEIAVPWTVIDKVEHLGNELVGNRRLESVRLHLKMPKEPCAAAYARLLEYVILDSERHSDPIQRRTSTIFYGDDGKLLSDGQA